MAHQPPGRSGRLRAAGACALALASCPLAQALDVGEPRVRSSLGEPLDASLPVRADPGERFAGKCFVVAPGPGLPQDPALGVTLERSRGRASLRVRSAKPVEEPAAGLRVGADCEKPAERLKDVPLLIDPPTVKRPAPPPSEVPPPRVRPAAEAPGAAAEMRPRRAVQASAAAPVAPSTPKPDAVPAAVPPRPPGTGFSLKLSGAVDLSPSRGIDENQRQQLRGRLALLDSDDQVSTMLAMRHQLQQLESKVAALQLKVAQMPASFPPPKVEAKSEAPKAEPPKIEAPKIVEAPKVVEAPKPAPPKPAPAKAPVVAAPGLLDEVLGAVSPFALPLLGAIAVLLGLAFWWRRRRREPESLPAAPAEEPRTTFVEAPSELADEPEVDLPLGEIAPPIAAAPPPIVERAIAAATPAPAAPPPGLLPDDAASVRQRYIAERFPEVARGSVDLADPESVVKGARLFYEDGELPRAVELLQYAIESQPEEPRPWLALFEIFRLERLGGEFSQLAARFRERFGDGEDWNKVRFFGREVDPGNELYRDEMPATLETIGPREARRLAAQNATYDPVTENWLRAPMDFQNEVLATELRRALMADASLTEADLVPNPMPALRGIEMFTVA